MTRFGWFTADVDERAQVAGTGVLLPLFWQRMQPAGHVRAGRPDPVDNFEGLLPLENGASCWLFGEHDPRDDTWQVDCALYVPCPLHPLPEVDSRRCEHAAVWFDAERTAVTNPAGCAGPMCEGCFHGMGDSITADPGDVDEFWQLMKHWSRLAVIATLDVPDHESYLDFAHRHKIEA